MYCVSVAVLDQTKSILAGHEFGKRFMLIKGLYGWLRTGFLAQE